MFFPHNGKNSASDSAGLSLTLCALQIYLLTYLIMGALCAPAIRNLVLRTVNCIQKY